MAPVSGKNVSFWLVFCKECVNWPGLTSCDVCSCNERLRGGESAEHENESCDDSRVVDADVNAGTPSDLSVVYM